MPTDVSLLEAMRSRFAAGDLAYAKALSNMGRRPSCSRGCGACCDLLNIITWPEALVLAETILEAGELERLLPKLVDQARAASAVGTNPGTYYAARIRCAFLSPEQACELYAERPFSCRFHVVFSPAAMCDDRSPDSPVETVEPLERAAIAVRLMEPILTALDRAGHPLARTCAPLPLMVLEALRYYGVPAIPETERAPDWMTRREETDPT